MKYRSSPHTSTGKTPASMMFNREMTTRLSLLFPSKESDVSKGPEEEKHARKHKNLKRKILYGLECIQRVVSGAQE